jgi:hypothetical protein
MPQIDESALQILAEEAETDFESCVYNEYFDCHCVDCNATIQLYAKNWIDRNHYETLGIICEACMQKYLHPVLEAKRHALAKELSALSYDEYLQTPYWRELRLKVLNRDGHCCRLCRSTDQLEVHHNTYERRGMEELDDLVTLCKKCHQNFHDNRSIKPKANGELQSEVNSEANR